MAAATKIVVLRSLAHLPGVSQEFRRIEWSVPDTQASVPILAAEGVGESGSGLFEQAAHEGASSLARRPSPSGIHQAPIHATPGERGPAAAPRLVRSDPSRAERSSFATRSRSGARAVMSASMTPRSRVGMRRCTRRRARIADLGSSNGTYVNGMMIAEPRMLAPGDEVRVGDTAWKVEGAVGEEPPKASKVANSPPCVARLRHPSRSRRASNASPGLAPRISALQGSRLSRRRGRGLRLRGGSRPR